MLALDYSTAFSWRSEVTKSSLVALVGFSLGERRKSPPEFDLTLNFLLLADYPGVLASAARLSLVLRVTISLTAE
jgi:hypothetical protein